MKKLEVSIMGSTFRLTCPDGGEKTLQEAVARVDKEMCAIRDSGKVKVRERIAVLAALNLAYVLAQKPSSLSTSVATTSSSEPAEAAPSLGPDGSLMAPQPRVDDEQIDWLITRLDRALEHDGHLI